MRLRVSLPASDLQPAARLGGEHPLALHARARGLRRSMRHVVQQGPLSRVQVELGD